MIVGYRVLCKNDLQHGGKWCVKNSYYSIIHVSNDFIKIECEPGYGSIIFHPNSRVDGYKFEEYFYTEKELRKMKLERLSNV